MRTLIFPLTIRLEKTALTVAVFDDPPIQNFIARSFGVLIVNSSVS
jgi:hypothetical protein